MTTRETILDIMKEIKPTVDFAGIDGIVESGYLDSMEFMGLIARLDEVFGIEIDFDDIVPENFNTLAQIEALVTKLQK